MYKKFILFLTGALLALAVNAKADSVYTVSSDDDELEASRIARFLINNGFDTTRVNEEVLAVVYDGTKFLFSPKMNKGGLSRLSVHLGFQVKPLWRNSPDVLVHVVRLNRDFNFAAFYLSEDGESLILRSAITFVDKLEIREVREFMEHMDLGIYGVILQNPETAEYIE